MSDNHPAVQFLIDNGETVRNNSFLSDIRRKYLRFKSLSPAQIAAVERSIAMADSRKAEDAKRAALAASGVKAPEGEQHVRGTIVAVKNGTYGFGALVTVEEGYRVWFRLPASLTRQVDSPVDARGRKVEFIATLTRSDNDPLFAFAKRPTNAKFLAS